MERFLIDISKKAGKVALKHFGKVGVKYMKSDALWDCVTGADRGRLAGRAFDREGSGSGEHVIGLAHALVRRLRCRGTRWHQHMIDVRPGRREDRRSQHTARQDGGRRRRCGAASAREAGAPPRALPSRRGLLVCAR